jgi:hypothetical protein
MGRPWGKARLNWARRTASASVHDRPYATARLCTLRSVSCRVHTGSATYGGKSPWQSSMRVSALARFGKRMRTERTKSDPFTTTIGIEGDHHCRRAHPDRTLVAAGPAVIRACDASAASEKSKCPAALQGLFLTRPVSLDSGYALF